MAFRVGRERDGQRGGRSIANAEVMEVMQRITARLEAMESRNQGNVDDGMLVSLKLNLQKRKNMLQLLLI